MKDKIFNRFCWFAILEGCSYLFLLSIAMPLKYYAGNPNFVHYTGWIHGLLFIGYLVYLIKLAMRDNWPTSRLALAFFATFLPFGTFYVEWYEKKLYKFEADKAVAS